jgi:hypothetical protein
MPTRSPITSHPGYLRNVKYRFVAGAVAGNITVTGIKTTDKLLDVRATDATLQDISGEFTISAANTINNTGGTSTATKVLLVRWVTEDAGMG